MKKTILLTALGLSIATTAVQAQQEPQFSQFFQSLPMYNPASTGIEDYVDAKLGVRDQWSGFDNSPRNLYLSAHGPLRRPEVELTKDFSIRISDPSVYDRILKEEAKKPKIKHGVGGYVLAEENGPFKRYGLYGSYAFHLPVSEKLYVSLGASLGGVNKRVDDDMLRVRDEDETFNNFIARNSSDTYLDGKLGAMLYGQKFYFGYSANQLFQNKILTDGVSFDNKLNVNHFLTGGVTFDMGADFEFRPSTLIKYLDPNGITYDVNAKVRYLERYWAGAGYRGSDQNPDAVIGMLGATINDFVNFSYSFDYTVSEFNDYNSGTHEVVVGIMLFNNNGAAQYMW